VSRLRFWTPFFSVSFDGDAIRDDYVKFMNDAHLEKVQNRAPKMAWREGVELHLINLSSLLVIEPEEVIRGWRTGIETARQGKSANRADTCGYGTIVSLFDNLHIHSWKSDGLGIKWTESITVIPTDRKAMFEKSRRKPL
jgi:hypothetical protein